MTVREFNGTSDNLIQGLGAATSMAYGTAAMLVKFSTVTSFRSLFQLHDSSNTFVWTPLDLTNFSTIQWYAGGGSDSGFSLSTGIWYLIVIRKVTGSAVPRYSIYNYTAGTWTHGNFTGGAIGNGTAPGAGGRSGFAFQGSGDFFGGRVAAKAAWTNTLPWTADASGDTAIAASGLKDAASSWLSSSPSVCWFYDQAAVTTAVPDSATGGAGTQISRSGTTAITGDDPPGFSFGSGTAMNLGNATGTGAAQALANTKAVALGSAAGTGAAQALAAAKGLALGAAAGTGAPQAMTFAKGLALGTAAGAGTAQPASLTGAAGMTLDTATGTGAPQAMAFAKALTLDTATGSGAPAGIADAKGLTLAAAAGSGAAQPLVPGKALGLQAATGSGAAQAATFTAAGQLTMDTATGTGAAQAMIFSKAWPLGTAVGSGAAQALSGSKALALSAVAGTGAARTLSVGKQLALAAAGAAGAAQAMTFTGPLEPYTPAPESTRGTAADVAPLVTGSGTAYRATTRNLTPTATTRE